MNKRAVFIAAISSLGLAFFFQCDKPTAPSQHTLTATCNPPGAGTVSLNPSGGTYTEGTTVGATATAAPGFTFVNWSGDVTGTTGSISVLMNTAKSIIANFATTATVVLKIKSDPLPGFESTVDAVTTASNEYDSLWVRVDSLSPGDSVMNVVVDWGDSTPVKTYGGQWFTPGESYYPLLHWYVRVDSLTGLCVTTATVNTINGAKRDTSFVVKVLRKDEH
jgi:hypothetical protein